MGSFSGIMKNMSCMFKLTLGNAPASPWFHTALLSAYYDAKRALKTYTMIIKSPTFWLIYSTGFSKPLQQATQKRMTLGFFLDTKYLDHNKKKCLTSTLVRRVIKSI